jgi:Ran GTPase-activating protein (RanGAP) involved in mRNA processing and transport
MAKLSISPDDPAVKKVLKLLEKQKDKEEINLSNKGLTPNDIKFVLAFLKNRPLKRLNLSHNFLGDEGARLISEGFRYLPDLQVLDLGDNGIGDEGVHFIIKGLKDIPELQQLDLTYNNIKYKGNKIICKLIDQKDYPQYIKY